MKYRDKTEIIQDILQTARSDGNGAVKTQLMYKAFVSSYQIRDYLSILVDNDLLQCDLNSRRFKITEKGIRFLQICDQIGGLVKEEAVASSN